MSIIKIIEHVTIYENPIPSLVSRHAYFPGLVNLPSGGLIALFPIGEAFEASMTMYVSQSNDNGRSWMLDGPMHDDFELGLGALKPTLLDDGTLIALGYGFNRNNPEILANPETGGLPNGANYVSFSKNEGCTWTFPEAISLSRPEILETSGPCTQLRNGDIIATGTPFPMWDGTIPSGRKGIVLRSRDSGKSWDDQTVFYDSVSNNISPYETHSCEMQDGRIVIMIWCLDETAGKSLTNHVVVSHDNGFTWSEPIDTSVPAQASNIMYLGDNKLLAVHCQREGDVGLYVHVVDFADDKWNILAKTNIWDKVTSMHIGTLADMGAKLKFGQPSLTQLEDGDILATHWAVENGQGRILTHRIRVNLAD